MPDKLLIADDEPDIVETLARCFASRGYDILRAGSGEEAVRMAGRAPDLILLDISMPDLDGLEVCRRLWKENFPLVLGGGCCDDIPSVDFDFEGAGYQCGKLLYREGRRNVVFFPNIFPWSLEADGLQRAYREEGIVLNENLFLKDCYTAHEKIRDILSYGIPVDAIYGQMLTYNTIEDYLLEIDPDLYKRCTLVASGGIVVPPRHPFHHLVYVVPFEEYGKQITEVLKNVFSGKKDPQHRMLKIKIDSR